MTESYSLSEKLYKAVTGDVIYYDDDIAVEVMRVYDYLYRDYEKILEAFEHINSDCYIVIIIYNITCDCLISDQFMLEKVHKVSVDNFVLLDHRKDCIFVNKDLDNLSEIKELIIKIMRSKYLPEKLLDRFQELSNEDADRILIRIFHDWREEKRKNHYMIQPWQN